MQIKPLLEPYILQGSFQLPSGKTTTRYFDQGYLFHPQVKLEVAAALGEKVAQQVDLVAGMELGGVVLAAAVSDIMMLPFLAIRKPDRYEYSSKNPIEGAYRKGHRVLLVEDTVRSGRTLNQAQKILENEGLVVAQVLVVCDRTPKGLYDSLIKLPL